MTKANTEKTTAEADNRGIRTRVSIILRKGKIVGERMNILIHREIL